MKCHPNRPADLITDFARPRRTLGAMIVVVFLVFATLQPPANAQAPQYQLTWLDGSVSDINDLGTVVGSEGGEASMYDQGTGMQNLNELDGVFWTDLDTNETWDRFDTPWKATWARGINVGGQIVGHASHANPDIGQRVFVLSFPVGSSPEITLLKRFGDGHNQGAAINDLGIVVGWTEGTEGYTIVFDPRATPPYEPVGIPGDFSGPADPQEINNHGVIVTRSSSVNHGSGCVISPILDPQTGIYDYTQAVPDPFPNDEFFGINDLGMISGLRHPILKGNPSQRQDGGAFRFQYPGAPTDLDLLIVDNGTAESHFCDVNELGDVCFREGDRAWVSLEGKGIFNLDNHIQFDSPEDESDCLNGNPKQPRGINDKGQIIVRTWPAAVRPALLTPIVPGPPTPGIVVTPTTGLITTEAGGTDTFNVTLDAPPSGAVTVSVNSLDPTEGDTNVTSLTFDQFDWDLDKMVTVTGVQDSESDGDIVYFIEVENATNTVQVEVTNEDDDPPPPPGGSETESINYLPDGLEIPDNNSNGLISEIQFGNSYVIDGLTVELGISHPRPSDLIVNLYGPDDPLLLAPVRLTNFSGDNIVADFDGTSSDGTWTLKVIDNKKKKKGTLDFWSITVDY